MMKNLLSEHRPNARRHSLFITTTERMRKEHSKKSGFRFCFWQTRTAKRFAQFAFGSCPTTAFSFSFPN